MFIEDELTLRSPVKLNLEIIGEYEATTAYSARGAGKQKGPIPICPYSVIGKPEDRGQFQEVVRNILDKKARRD